jgi:DNA-binding LacI/PurR family transcriptional regulator
LSQASRQPTILDVASAAGVSKSTVSNVVRGAPNISPETRRRVLETIASVGYRPNAVARSLVRRRTTTVGILVGDLANPFYSELAKLVEQRLSAAGYAAMICNTDGHALSERLRIESLLEQRAAGIVMLQFSGEWALADELRAQGVPLVVVSCWESKGDCVAVDDAAGVGLAVRHLLELGHRRIAYLSSGLVEPKTDRARFDGYRHALAAVRLVPKKTNVLRWEDPAYLRSDRQIVRDIERLLGGLAPPTAFFVSNDLVAIDLIETLEELGLRVPDDVSVVGFDNIALAGLARISLTTVAQPRDELARLGVAVLIERIEGGKRQRPRRIRLTPELVVRRSTAPAHSADKRDRQAGPRRDP